MGILVVLLNVLTVSMVQSMQTSRAQQHVFAILEFVIAQVAIVRVVHLVYQLAHFRLGMGFQLKLLHSMV
jgi:hypothetical protein